MPLQSVTEKLRKSVEVAFAEMEERKECEIAAKMNLNRELDCIENFGCTDCSCKSHLFFSMSLTRLKEHVYNCFCASGLDKVKEYRRG